MICFEVVFNFALGTLELKMENPEHFQHLEQMVTDSYHISWSD